MISVFVGFTALIPIVGTYLGIAAGSIIILTVSPMKALEFLIFIVIIAYTVLSGLWGVALMDVFQGILQTFSVIALIVITLRIAGGIGGVEEFYRAAGDPGNLSLFQTDLSWYEIILYIAAFGLFFLMNDQTNWERIYASKGSRTARWGFMLPLVITMISLVLISYLGVFQKVITGGVEDSQSILYTFLLQRGGSVLTVLIMVGLIAAIMSSADSFLLASGVMVAEDIIKAFIVKNASDRELIFYTRIFVVVTGAIAFTFAINIHDILSLWLTGIGLTSILLVPGYFLGWRKNPPHSSRVLAGMAVGGIGVCLMLFGLIPVDPIYICAFGVLNFLVCMIPSCIYVVDKTHRQY